MVASLLALSVLCHDQIEVDKTLVPSEAMENMRVIRTALTFYLQYESGGRMPSLWHPETPSRLITERVRLNLEQNVVNEMLSDLSSIKFMICINPAAVGKKQHSLPRDLIIFKAFDRDGKYLAFLTRAGGFGPSRIRENDVIASLRKSGRLFASSDPLDCILHDCWEVVRDRAMATPSKKISFFDTSIPLNQTDANALEQAHEGYWEDVLHPIQVRGLRLRIPRSLIGRRLDSLASNQPVMLLFQRGRLKEYITSDFVVRAVLPKTGVESRLE